MLKRDKNSGFTIVELLIVIVIIGILATITIVAYNGITKKARESTLMSDLNNDARLLEMYKAENGDYPAQGDEGQANNGQGLVGSNGNVLTYSVLAGKYCLEAKDSSGQYVYRVEQDKSGISEGDCPVMPTGPVITNLISSDPGFEEAVNRHQIGFGGAAAAGYTDGTLASLTSNPVSGDKYLRATVNSAKNAVLLYSDIGGNLSTSGQYTLSFYLRSSNVGANLAINVAYIDWSTTVGMGGSSIKSLTTASGWTRYLVTGAFGNRSSDVGIDIFVSLVGLTAGDWVEVDDAMLTSGPALYSYADGDSLGWSWSSTAHLSKSSGPSSLP